MRTLHCRILLFLKYFKIIILFCEFRSLVKSRRIYNPSSEDPHLDVPGVINFDQVL